MSTSEAVAAFRLLEPTLAATTFVYLPRSLQDMLLQALEEMTIAAILNELAPDDRTAILEEQSSDETERLLTLLSRLKISGSPAVCFPTVLAPLGG